MLRKHKKITKKELKKDPFLIFIAQSYEYLRTEWLKITATFLAVVIVLSSGIFFVKWRSSSTVKSYNKALSALYNNSPEGMDLLNKVVQNHGRSKMAAEALMILGNISFGQKDSTNAERYFRQYIDKFSNDPIYTYNSYNLIGSIYEGKGDFKKAAQTYEGYINKFNDSVFLPIMYVNAGKAFLTAGDKESAKRNFTKVTTAYKDTQEEQEAKFYLEMLN
jgi:TolA-binding protein